LPKQLPARTYAFDISIPREVKGELRIVSQFGKDDLERLSESAHRPTGDDRSRARRLAKNI
jgi:hypothetical protein